MAKNDHHPEILSSEKELLAHVLKARSNAKIAEHLRITLAETKDRLERLFRKLRVENRTQAAIWTLEHFPELDEPR